MKTEVRMALEAIEEELQKTNVCGYSVKIIRTALEESTNSSHNKQSVQCQHSFYAVRCANIVRCNKCGAEFPLISTC